MTICHVLLYSTLKAGLLVAQYRISIYPYSNWVVSYWLPENDHKWKKQLLTVDKQPLLPSQDKAPMVHHMNCSGKPKAGSTRTSRSRMLSAQRDVQQDQWMHFNAWLVQILQFWLNKILHVWIKLTTHDMFNEDKICPQGSSVSGGKSRVWEREQRWCA